MTRPIIIGTRGSALALAQTAIVREALAVRHPSVETRVERLRTEGDIRADVPLSAMRGQGVFVAAIEAALRAGDVDIAVHSAKDLPSRLADGVEIGAWLPRADARDVLVSRGGSLASIPTGGRVGTSSLRRSCQLRALRPDLDIIDVRGNVDTRLRKLENGEFDALVLAAAGLLRLGRLDTVTEYFGVDVMVPSPGQGAIAIEIRAHDTVTAALVAPLNDPATAAAVSGERAFLAHLGAGCLAAVGAYATVRDHELSLSALIGAPDGRAVRGARKGDVHRGVEVAESLAAEMLARGGQRFLAEAARAADSSAA